MKCAIGWHYWMLWSKRFPGGGGKWYQVRRCYRCGIEHSREVTK